MGYESLLYGRLWLVVLDIQEANRVCFDFTATEATVQSFSRDFLLGGLTCWSSTGGSGFVAGSQSSLREVATATLLPLKYIREC